MRGSLFMQPVQLPEFNRSFNWAMCRNTWCPHFGVAYTGEVPAPGAAPRHDDHYRLDEAGRLRCKYCGLSFGLKSNRAVRPVARYFLSLSLPFADCPDETCENHGINVYEHYAPRDDVRRAGRRYGREGEYRARCAACQGRISLGEALGLSAGRATSRSLTAILRSVLTQQTVTNVLETYCPGLGASAYYARLARAGARLRDYHARRNARLLDPGLKLDQPVRVYTDVMQVALRRAGDAGRQQQLRIIISVLALERSGFILAAHPAFLPDSARHTLPGPLSLIDEVHGGATRAHQRQWDCLDHLGQLDIEALNTPDADLPDPGRGGYFVRSPYVEAAHFLVVQKMLGRAEKVHYFMDADRALYTSALCVLAPQVQAGRAEIALFQHDKTAARRGGDLAPFSLVRRTAQLRTAHRRMEQRFAARARPAGTPLPLAAGHAAQKRAATLFKHAPKGGYSRQGGWAWLAFPPDGGAYRDCRSLWLTRTPEKDFERDGLGLLLHATLQPVDTCINALRQRVRALSRPRARALGGPGYQHSYALIEHVLAELWIYLLAYNYRTRPRGPRQPIRALALGLISDSEAARVARGEIAVQFRTLVNEYRLGLREAARMTRWQR